MQSQPSVQLEDMHSHIIRREDNLPRQDEKIIRKLLGNCQQGAVHSRQAPHKLHGFVFAVNTTPLAKINYESKNFEPSKFIKVTFQIA